MRSRLLPAIVILALVALPAPVAAQTPATVPSCDAFDVWIWAQTVYETVYEADPDRMSATLDPDGDTIACPDLPLAGFALALWTDTTPAAAEPAQVVGITDGDTLVVTRNGVRETIGLAAVVAPATFNLGGVPECGGADATTYLSYVLGFAPGGTVYLEPGTPARDADGRAQVYVWIELGGAVYLVNEVMLRAGWAALAEPPPGGAYLAQLEAAASYSRDRALGGWLRCGGFGRPLDAMPTARRSQPDQGQFPPEATPAD
jgi:endonuclease YncB( thermonuclease family)